MYKVEIIELITDDDGCEVDTGAEPIALVYAKNEAQALSDAKDAVAAVRLGIWESDASYRDPVKLSQAPCGSCRRTFPVEDLYIGHGVDPYGNGPAGLTDNVLACAECEPWGKG